MDNVKMGQFIAELRKSKQLTQRELAGRLGITDKAVSKWERGLSCPDIVLLPELAEALGITVGELLAGEKAIKTPLPSEAEEHNTKAIDNVLQYAGETVKNKIVFWQRICGLAFSFALFIGLAVCIICDLAGSGSLTWSCYPISSIIFAWLVFFPLVRFWKKGIAAALVSLTVFIIPFLFTLDKIIAGSGLLMPIGVRVSVISLAYLWFVYIMHRVLKNKKLLSSGLSVLLLIPLYLLITDVVSVYVGTPIWDIWTVIDIAAFALAAAVLFLLHAVRRK